MRILCTSQVQLHKEKRTHGNNDTTAQLHKNGSTAHFVSDSNILMSGPANRPSTGGSNKNSTREALKPPQVNASPCQTVLCINSLHVPRGPISSRSLSDIALSNPMTETVLRPWYDPLAASPRSFSLGQIDPACFMGTRGIFSSLPQLHQQRLDSLTASSLQPLTSAMACFRSASLQSPINVAFENQLAAAQRTNLTLLDKPIFLRPTSYPPNQWPSSGGLGDATNAFSRLPSLHPQPQRSFTPGSFGGNSTSALSIAAWIRERVLPFSPEIESQIPLVAGPESFPMVLHRALAELELIEGGGAIATFLPDGLSFCFKNQALFTQKVLPLFFPRMKSFASFQRQLNLYDFERVGGTGANRWAYRHKLFVRDHPAISISMRPSKNKRDYPVMSNGMKRTTGPHPPTTRP